MSKAFGFTLLECLVVILIVSGLLCVAVPFFKERVDTNNTTTLVHDIESMLLFARSEAFLRHQTLVLRPLSSDANWAEGAALYIETKAQRPQEREKMLHVFHWRQKTQGMHWHGFASPDDLVIFPTLKTLAMNGYFEVIGKGKPSQKICISRFGQVRLSCL
ncbi:MAG: pilus assembly FimT family protein [Legionellaceae bacterium]